MTIVPLPTGTSWLVPPDFTTSNSVVATGGSSGVVETRLGLNLIPGSTIKIQIGDGNTILFDNADMPLVTAFKGSGSVLGSIVVTYTPLVVPVKPLYRPPTGITKVEYPYLSAVTAVDPTWSTKKHRELEYVFGSRGFYADPYTRGAYNNNPN